MIVEQKVLVSIRKILLADATIAGIVSTNVYASHISSITKPIYPAISLHLLTSSGADDMAMDYADVKVQIDGWFPTEQYDMTAVLNLAERVRKLLHRQFITDSTIPVAGAGFESSFASPMVEDDAKLIHLPMVYSFKAF